MKIRSSNIPTVDWSEFHVWSPNGVYKRLKVDGLKGAPAWSDKLSAVRRGEAPKPAKPLMDHHHAHRHGLVQEAYAHLLAGALGGSTATYLTHWLDTVKVRMQTRPGVYPGGVACLRATVGGGGVRALYQGAVPAVVGQAGKTAVVFLSYGLCEEAVRRATGCEYVEDMTIWHHAGSGAMTGVVASFVLCPLELLKCRLQAISQLPDTAKTHHLKSLTSLGMVRRVLKAEGLRGLYRGLPGIWVKEIPGSFIYFGSYEFAKYVMRTISEKEHLNSRAVFICGMYAGLCFCITHPIESVKTRVQVMSAVSDTKGFVRMFWSILRSEGVMPLFAGMGPSMVRACLYSGLQLVTYEAVKDALLDD